MCNTVHIRRCNVKSHWKVQGRIILHLNRAWDHWPFKIGGEPVLGLPGNSRTDIARVATFFVVFDWRTWSLLSWSQNLQICLGLASGDVPYPTSVCKKHEKAVIIRCIKLQFRNFELYAWSFNSEKKCMHQGDPVRGFRELGEWGPK